MHIFNQCQCKSNGTAFNINIPHLI